MKWVNHTFWISVCSQWLYDLCRGVESEAVKPRQLPKSIGCSKNFPGKTSLATKEQVEPHLLHVPSRCLKFVRFNATMNDLRRYSTGSISWPWNWKKG